MSRKKRSRKKGERPRLGKLPPLYRFILNPYTDVRFSTCPECSQRTLLRKVPLAVHVDPHYPVMLNKKCRYCKHCDLLIAHQDELEQMLAMTFQERVPGVVGNDYLVLGTYDKATWRRRNKETVGMAQVPEFLHDFKEYLTIKSTPAHWAPEEQEPPKAEDLLSTTIDDPEQVERLLEKMEHHLPIRAEVNRSTANYLIRQGTNIPRHRKVTIDKIFYHGDDGGIVCGISPPGSKEAIVISLTHLKIPYSHPLEKEIRAYQRARTSKLDR